MDVMALLCVRHKVLPDSYGPAVRYLLDLYNLTASSLSPSGPHGHLLKGPVLCLSVCMCVCLSVCLYVCVSLSLLMSIYSVLVAVCSWLLHSICSFLGGTRGCQLIKMSQFVIGWVSDESILLASNCSETTEMPQVETGLAIADWCS